MERAKPASGTSRGLAYLLSGQELSLALAGGIAMLVGYRTTKQPEVALTEALFCLLLVLFCSAFFVRLDRGHLRLTMIATQVSAMVLPVPLAGFMGLVAGLLWLRHGSTPGHRYAGTGASIFWTSA